MLREIARPMTNELFIRVPDSYIGQEVEVLVLPSFEILNSSVVVKEKAKSSDIAEIFKTAKKYKVQSCVDLNAMANEVNG